MPLAYRLLSMRLSACSLPARRALANSGWVTFHLLMVLTFTSKKSPISSSVAPRAQRNSACPANSGLKVVGRPITVGGSGAGLGAGSFNFFDICVEALLQGHKGT